MSDIIGILILTGINMSLLVRYSNDENRTK